MIVGQFNENLKSSLNMFRMILLALGGNFFTILLNE